MAPISTHSLALVLEEIINDLKGPSDKLHRPFIHLSAKALLDFIGMPSNTFGFQDVQFGPVFGRRAVPHKVLNIAFGDGFRVQYRPRYALRCWRANLIRCAALVQKIVLEFIPGYEVA